MASRNDGRGIGTLVRELADGSATLVRGEARIARVEISEVVKGIATGTGFIAVGGVLALLGGLSLLAGVILLIGDQWLPRDLYWVAALLVVVVSGGIALLFARRGLSMLSPSALAPDQTVETLKEDKEWLKRRMTSGATSS
ncbi:MAG TPA: phage holin family protein [Gemmatimonadaceae bacterium]|nr:phage holin family protein [Gemmatimonadaceae bacterium]